MRKHLLLLLFLCSFLGRAQAVTVPDNLYLADQRIILSASGRQEIQKRVDALMKYPKYFQARVDLADTYFPIIERVFREEGLPDDFKYLALIESGLVSDAVSTSNAVGFWQFKKDTATDYGLRVNENIDERKHIVESSRSAARYLLKSNNLYYKNWHNTILSYYHGFTGAKAFARPEHVDRKEMEVTDKTDIYILKLLAHKVAYETAIGRNPAPAVVLQEIPVSGKSLSDIALETTVSEGELQRYNKWLAGPYIPNDKTYTVIIPITNPDQQSQVLASRQAAGPTVARADNPVVTEKAGKREFKKRNGLKVIIARRGDTKDQLALQARMSTKRFLALNDLYSFDPIVEGEAYYIERKKSKAHVQYHVVKPGERVQQIAQQYGVKMRSILWNNRMKANEMLATGRLLWMQHRRPSNTPIEFQKTYPGIEPARAPANPVVLAHGEVLDEINDRKAPLYSQEPEAAPKPARDYPAATPSVNTPSQEKKEQPAAVNTEKEQPASEPAAVTTDVALATGPAAGETAAPASGQHSLDVALAQTNEETDKDETLLTEEIDQQVEHINQQAPTLYKKTPAAETFPAPGSAPAAKAAEAPETQEPAGMKPWPGTAEKPAVVLREPTETTQQASETPAPGVVKSGPAPAEKPAVILREPAETPKKTAPARNETAPDKNLAASPVLKEPAPEQPAQTPGIHVVAKGETMYAISRKYNITTDELRTWNGLGDLPLSIGQSLKVVAPAVTSSSGPLTPAGRPQDTTAATAAKGTPATHTVSMGESMYQISRRYGVTIKDIMEWNRKADFNVVPGEKLLIKTVADPRD
jgi:membrane-bound lytic murein transglycosylase D